MKAKIMIGIVFLLLATYPTQKVFGQEATSEIEVGFGAGTTPTFVEAISEVLVSLASLGSVDVETSTTGGISFGYKSRVSDQLDLGVNYVYQHFDKTLSQDNTQVGTGDINWHSVLGSLDYYWVDNTNFGLFSSAGLGFSAYNEEQRDDSGQMESESQLYVAYQLDIVGVEFGNNFNGSLALGFGYEGILSMNLGYRF